MTAEQFVDFLNKSQRDPRLNEILYPYANVVRAKDLISQHEPSKSNAQRGRIAWKNLCMLFYVNSACLGAEVACMKGIAGNNCKMVHFSQVNISTKSE
jgi:hypothetical protein